jgi:hypothetical protein
MDLSDAKTKIESSQQVYSQERSSGWVKLNYVPPSGFAQGRAEMQV